MNADRMNNGAGNSVSGGKAAPNPVADSHAGTNASTGMQYM